MTYKSLLTIVYDPNVAAQTVAAAMSVARREDAHLEVLCVGIDNTEIGYYYPDAGAVILENDIARAKQEVAALESQVTAQLHDEELRFSVEAAVTHIGGLTDLVARRARFNDLVILPKPYGRQASANADLLVEAAMFQGQAPVLVIPLAAAADTARAATFGQEIVVAWNESAEAMVAIRAALPLLRAAKHVTIAIIDPSHQSDERSDPGGALAQLLARHGVKVDVAVLAKTMPRVTDVLNRLVRDRAADLLVMGAYGHSRFREAILGGATRDMLELADVPVFMAH